MSVGERSKVPLREDRAQTGMQVASGGRGITTGGLALIPRKLKDWVLIVGIAATWSVWFAVGQALRAMV